MSSSNLPRRGPHQQPTDMMARTSTNVQKVMSFVHELKKTEVTAFTEKELADKFKSSLQKLNVVTGAPCSHGEAYIKPVAPERVREWLEKYAPEESNDLESYDIDFRDLDFTRLGPGFDFHEAIELSVLLLNRVRFSKDSNMGVMMGKESHWNEAELPRDCISPHLDWEAREPFHQVHPSQYNLDLDWVTKPDPKLPHMQCWLADELPIQDGPYLSPAELITTLTLAIAKIRTEQPLQVAVIPITVFSCSGRKLRIVQGAINFHNLNLDFRCSDVLDFSVGGVRSNSRNARTVATVLGWVLELPAVGKIFPGTSQ